MLKYSENSTYESPEAIRADLTFAKLLHSYELNIVPGKENKSPSTKWSEWQTERQTEEFVEEKFSVEGYDGFCIICGTGSGNLLAFDVDSKNHPNPEQYKTEVLRSFKKILPADFPVIETPSGGYHILVKCENG